MRERLLDIGHKTIVSGLMLLSLGGAYVVGDSIVFLCYRRYQSMTASNSSKSIAAASGSQKSSAEAK